MRSLLFVLLACFMVNAQIVGVEGFVRDSTGAGMMGVPICVLSLTGDTLCDTITSSGGYYYLSRLTSGWTGQIIPSKTGYGWEPIGQCYFSTPVTTNLQLNWTGRVIHYSITGIITESNTGLAGVGIQVNAGVLIALSPTTEDGLFSVEFKYGTTARITPVKDGWLFEPETFTFNPVDWEVAYAPRWDVYNWGRDSTVNIVAREDIVSVRAQTARVQPHTSRVTTCFDLSGRRTAVSGVRVLPTGELRVHIR